VVLVPAPLNPQELPTTPEPKAPRESFWLHPNDLLVPGRDREALAATPAPSGQDLATVSRGHACPKTVGTLAAGSVGLVGPFHDTAPDEAAASRRRIRGPTPGLGADR